MGDEIRPFKIHVSEADLEDLKKRLRATRWPDPQTVPGWSQGVPLDYVQKICEYWARDYDWRKIEARLNALPQFHTDLDGLAIYFLHVRSPHADAGPLILTHGWPGSIIDDVAIRKELLIRIPRPTARTLRPSANGLKPVARIPVN
jgi:hypothetical protein